MRITFIIVAYKTPEKEINRLKKEIAQLKLNTSEIIVIDNTNNNLGFAYAVNKGIEISRKNDSDLVVVANPDISLEGLSGTHLLEGSKHFDIYSFAMSQHGKTYYGGIIDKWRLSGGLTEEEPHERFKNCDFVSGSLMVIKRTVLERMSGFDESYFLYYEDVDFCYRAKKEGFTIGIDSKLSFVHYETSKDNPERITYLAINRLRFFWKYATIRQKMRELIRIPKTIYESKKVLIFELLKRKFLVNFLTLNASSFLNKLFTFILFIFLIKYLSIGDYGIYTLVWAQVGLLSPFLDLGTTTYGLIHISHDQTKHFNSLLSFRLCIALVIFVLTLIVAKSLHFDNRIVFFILLTSISIFTNMWSGSYLLLTSLKGRNYLSAIVSLVFNFIYIAVLILIIIVFKNLTSIFVVTFIAYLAYTFGNIFLVKKELPNLFLSFDFKNWIAIFKNSYIYVLIAFFAGLYFKLDVVVLKLLKTNTEVGIYSAGYKFFEATIFIASSYSFAAAPVLSRYKRENSLLFFSKIKKDVLFLSIFGFAVSTLIFFFSPFILPMLIKNYSESILNVLRILIFGLPFILISTVFLNAIYILKKAYLVIFLFIFQSIFNLCANLILIPHFSYFASAWVTLLGEVINALILFFVFQTLKTYRKDA